MWSINSNVDGITNYCLSRIVLGTEIDAGAY